MTLKMTMSRGGLYRIFVILACLQSRCHSVSNEDPAKLVRITTGEPPDSNSGPTIITGLGSDYIDWISRKYHLVATYSRIYQSSASQNFIGLFENGTWNGMIGDLTSDAADWAIGGIGARAVYNSYVELTFPYMETSFSIFVPFPRLENNMWAFLKPFDTPMWLLITASLFSVSIVMWVCTEVYVLATEPKPNGTKRKTRSFGSILLYFLTVLTSQGGEWNHRSKSFVVLGSAWCLVCVVLVNAYNGDLISYLTTVTPKPIVSSLSDLVSKPEVEFYTFNNSYYAFLLQSATAGPEKLLGDTLRQYPERVLPTSEACLKRAEKGPYVCFMSTGSGNNFVKNRYKATGKCTVVRISPFVGSFHPIFLVRKNSPLFDSINKGIIWARSYGLDQQWYSRYLLRGQQCSMFTKQRASLAKISLPGMYGAFVVLIIGYALSTVVFFTEVCVSKRAKTQKSIFN